MKPSQKIDLAIRELRGKLLKLGGRGDALTPDEKTEFETLPTEMRAKEVEFRAAVIAEDKATVEAASELEHAGGDPEVRERLELRAKTGIAEFLKAAAGGTSVTGAAAEFAASLGCPTSGHLPMSLFPAHRVETRAITPGPNIDGPARPIVPFVFERSAAASLGIEMPSVGAGMVQIPRITTAPPADTLAKDGAAPSTAAAVTLDSQTPVRIAGQFEIRIEDLAIYPPLEAALGQSMQGSLSSELDEQTFNGASGELNGLFVQATNVNAAGSVETYPSGIQRYAALVDGSHAYTLADVRAIIGSKTFALYAGLFANSGKGETSLFDYLVMHLGSIRVSDRVPGVSSSAQKGIAVLTASAESPKIHVWDALQIVRDPYSGAGAGKVTITATALVSPLFIPHGTSQVKEIHPKLS